MDDKQQAVIHSLIETGCNITASINENEIDLKTFYEWLKIDEFRDGYDTAIQVRDDEALTSFMDLVKSGDRGASIEYQKMQRQREDLNEIKSTKREVMRVLIESQDTKAACMKEYCQIFKCTKSASEDQFANVVAELGLETPHQRMKAKKIHKENLMSEMFLRGELLEPEMLKRLMALSLYDAENSEYPSERQRATEKVLLLKTSIEEMNDRIRREEETDECSLVEGFDSLASGMSPEKIAEYKKELITELLAIEDVK